MPQSLTQATVSKLVRGMITEAGELTFPEEATIDELNCVLMRDGTRHKRKGCVPITGSSAVSGTFNDNTSYSYFLWKNAGGNTGVNLLVLQIGTTLWFYDTSFPTITDGLKGFSVNLNDFRPGFKDITVCQYAPILGRLVVANNACNTFVINYDLALDDVTTETIDFVIRDFEWLSPTSQFSYAISAANVTKQRLYDTYNAGWYGKAGGAALNTYTAASTSQSLSGRVGGLDGGIVVSTLAGANNYPPLTFPWFSAKDSSGNFSVAEFEKIHAPTSITGNGLFRLDFFNKDRSAASGITDIPTEVEEARFKSVTAFAGRIFYAGLGSGKNSGKILFSQVILNSSVDNLAQTLGMCYQNNDPTAEDFSDILDTDGGEIVISDADNIKKLYSFNDSIFVFAENGVWMVTGIDGRFSPSSYYITKVSEVGIDGEQSFVAVENVPFWWSKQGIHTLNFGENGSIGEECISIATIQTFFEDIAVNARQNVYADYDLFNKKAYWWYPRNTEESNIRNKVLILDVPLKAFYPWELGGQTTLQGAVGTFYSESAEEYTFEDEVTVGLDTVTVGGEDVYLLSTAGGEDLDARIVVLYRDGVFGLSFNQFNSNTYTDKGNGPVSQTYSAYFEAGYFFGGDLLLKKTTPFLTTYLRSTEEGFTGNETDGYTAINPSSLLVTAYWDFKKEASSTQQAYRIKPYAMVDTADLANNQQKNTVHTTRLKLRGKGRSVRLRFEGEAGKGFIFLGYSMLVGINDRF